MSEQFQLTFEDDLIYQQYEKTSQLIKKGEFKKSFSLLENILNKNIILPDIYSTMKCLKFWIIRESKLVKLKGDEESATYLKNEWKSFENFLVEKSIHPGPSLALIKYAIFSQIIDHYIKQLQSLGVSNVELLISVSECFMAIREYKKAKDTLLYVRKFKKKDARIFAYLGECFYFLKDEIKSIAYFREAFFINAKMVDIDSVESPLIRNLVKKTMDNGFSGKEVNLWLPIYAEIENKFYVKRKLSGDELERLRKKIYHHEIECEVSHKSRNELEPILMNHYIFLMDYNKLSNSDEAKLQNKNILRKIRNINEGVYINLRKHYE